MLVSAACQGIFVPLILRFPASRLISLAGIAGNLFIVVLYVVSYTWGMPFGPTWVPFDPAVAHLVNPEVLGTAATAAEMGIVILLTVSLEGSLRRAVINALLVVGGAAVGAEDRGYPPLIGVPRKMTDRSGGGQPHRSLPGKKGAHGLLNIILVLVLSLVIVFGAVRPFVAEPFYVSSQSMLPTLKPHDRVLAAKYAYHLGKPRRGDLVVFENPQTPKQNLIKRVVGLPGDRGGHKGRRLVRQRRSRNRALR